MKALTVFLVVAVCALNLRADPRSWGSGGVPVRQGTHVNWNGSSAQNPAGFTLLVWSDTRTHERNVYAQLFAPGGGAMWDSGGVAVVTEPHLQRDPVACATAEGWIIAWADSRNIDPATCGEGYIGDIYAQKLDMSGTRMWPSNNYTGVRLESAESRVTTATIFAAEDGAGGALIAWVDAISEQNFGMNVYAQHVNASGEGLWPEAVRLTPNVDYLYSPRGSTDNRGNLVATWTCMAEGETSAALWAIKIAADGTFPWGSDPLMVGSGYQYYWPQCESLLPDGTGGMYLAYGMNTEEADSYTRLQRLTEDGQPCWTTDSLWLGYSYIGMAVTDSEDVNDGCLVFWRSDWNESTNLTVQKVTRDGRPLWGLGGNTIYYGQVGTPFQAVSDRNGGAVAAWWSIQEGTAGMRVARVDHAGVDRWHHYGLDIYSSETNPQIALKVARDTCEVFTIGSGSDYSGQLVYQVYDMSTGAPVFGESGGRAFAGGFGGWVSDCRVIGMARQRSGMVWIDVRTGTASQQLYFQMLDSAGTPMRIPNGEPLVPENSGTNSPVQMTPMICSDELGGFFCAFYDQTNSTNELRITRRNSTGQRVGGEAGEIVAEVAGMHWPVLFEPDGVGGCYMSWAQDGPGYGQRFKRMARINSGCNLTWGMIRTVGPVLWGQNDVMAMTATSNHECILFSVSSDPYVLEATIMGTDSVRWITNVATMSTPYVQVNTCADDQGGAFLLYSPYVWGVPGRVLLQHVDIDGSLRWSSPVLISDITVPARPIALKPDGAGGAYVLWSENTDGWTGDLHAQRISREGDMLWSDGGRLIADANGYHQFNSVVTADGNLFAQWQYRPDSHGDYIRGRYVSRNGEILGDWWQAAAGGVIVDSLTSDVAAVASLGGHGIVTAYVVATCDPYNQGDICAQRLDLDVLSAQPEHNAALPERLALGQNYPNPFNPTTSIPLELPAETIVTLKVYDISGREAATLLHGLRMNAGQHTVRFDASALASGVYFYRLETPAGFQTRKMVLMK